MVKTKEFINTLTAEYGHNDSKEVFLNDCMADLDSFGSKYGLKDIFHYTADEIDCEGNNIIDFLDDIDYNSITDSVLKEILIYLHKELKINTNQLPKELLNKLF